MTADDRRALLVAAACIVGALIGHGVLDRVEKSRRIDRELREALDRPIPYVPTDPTSIPPIDPEADR